MIKVDDRAIRSWGHFELRQDEETGRRYWFGAESDWKDGTEVGRNGVLILDSKHFEVGTRLVMTEPEQQEAE